MQIGKEHIEMLHKRKHMEQTVLIPMLKAFNLQHKYKTNQITLSKLDRCIIVSLEQDITDIQDYHAKLSLS